MIEISAITSSVLSLWLEEQGLKTEGDFIVAGYNPPWIPGFLARNEVLIMIKPGNKDKH